MPRLLNQILFVVKLLSLLTLCHLDNTENENCEENLKQAAIQACFSNMMDCTTKGISIPTSATTNQTTSSPLSPIVADIVFVLDASGEDDDNENCSQEDDEFCLQVNWVKKLLQNFSSEINQGNIRVGVIRFAYDTFPEIHLNNAENFTELSRRLNLINQVGDISRIGRGILRATQEFQSNGRKQEAKKIMIVLIRGHSENNERVCSQMARELGIVTVAVGVGSSYEPSKLMDVAGNESRVFEMVDSNSSTNVTIEVQQLIKNADAADDDADAADKKC